MQPASLPKKPDPFWVIVLLFIIFLAGGIFMLLNRTGPTPKTSPEKIKQIVITETPSPSLRIGGTLRLTTDKPGGVSGVGQDVRVTVVASSVQQKITGFDTVLTYDPGAVSVVSVENGVPDYRIFSQKKTGTYTVSGIPSTQETPLHEFADTPILTFLVQPLKAGKTELALAYVDGSKADSNLISDANADILVRVEGTTLIVGDQISLSEGAPREIPGTGLMLTLTKTELADAACRDCFTQADITVQKDGGTADISFQSGGFAGKANGTAGALGYTFSLVEIQAGKVTLVAVPE